jgi:hypothetical protein
MLQLWNFGQLTILFSSMPLLFVVPDIEFTVPWSAEKAIHACYYLYLFSAPFAKSLLGTILFPALGEDALSMLEPVAAIGFPLHLLYFLWTLPREDVALELLIVLTPYLFLGLHLLFANDVAA